MGELTAIIEDAGLPAGTPVVVAACGPSGLIAETAAGAWPSGRAVTLNDMFYAASMTKQVTGAALALLIRRGLVSADASLSAFEMDIPDWAGHATLRQVVQHVGGLPAAGVVEERIGSANWTEAVAIAALHASVAPAAPGSAFVYSNIGYILLARVISRVARQPFPDFVAEHLVAPAGIDGMVFAADLLRFEQTPLLGAKLPLTIGDGGLWTTARAFARWLDTQNRDVFGIAPLVESPGRLNGGAPVDYGFGIGIRTHRGRPLFVHGCGWTGAAARAIRSPSLGSSAVALAAGGTPEQLNRLATRALERMTD